MKVHRRIKILRMIQDHLYSHTIIRAGICDIVANLRNDDKITDEEYILISKYLSSKYPTPSWDIYTYYRMYNKGYGFVWQPQLVEPRIEFIDKLIEENIWILHNQQTWYGRIINFLMRRK